MKLVLVFVLPVFLFSASCKKEKKTNKAIPFLTGEKWTSDTITINPPVTYSQLSTNDQQTYRNALAWFKNAQLTFNEDGSVTSGGDWDFGYYKWKMINYNTDIEVLITTGTKDTLFNWMADNLYFAYYKSFSPFFNCTLIFK